MLAYNFNVYRWPKCGSKASKFILMMPKTQDKNQDSSKFQESKSHSIKIQVKIQEKTQDMQELQEKYQDKYKKIFSKKRLNSTICPKKNLNKNLFTRVFTLW